jgi:hypothetical protein
LEGVKVCQNAPSVSHLLFADNSLILFRANRDDVQTIQSILDVYEACSGQAINREKSPIMFSPNSDSTSRGEVMQTLNIQRETMNERYLGAWATRACWIE